MLDRCCAREADFTRARCTDVTFDKADLAGTLFTRTHLDGLDLRAAEFRSVDLREALHLGVIFRRLDASVVRLGWMGRRLGWLSGALGRRPALRSAPVVAWRERRAA